MWDTRRIGRRIRGVALQGGRRGPRQVEGKGKGEGGEWIGAWLYWIDG